MTETHHLTTKDLVTVALLSALGGALSTYVGYLGNLVNHVLGVPFGAGQFLAGLHVLWIALAVGITCKKGVGTVTGLLKGTVEFFMGSTHGIIIIAVSLVQGLLVDACLFSARSKRERSVFVYGFAGAVASASNVLVFQSVFFAGVPWIMIAMLCMLAGASGVIFAGWLPTEMLAILERAGMVEGKGQAIVDDDLGAERSDKKRTRTALISMLIVFSFLAVFTVGAVYYFFAVYKPGPSSSIGINGNVAKPYGFVYSDFKANETTIHTALVGSVTYVPPQNYTGIPLCLVLDKAAPRAGATEVVVTASDGYSATFSLSAVMNDARMIVVQEASSYRLVAANYAGGYWVDGIVTIDVR